MPPSRKKLDGYFKNKRNSQLCNEWKICTFGTSLSPNALTLIKNDRLISE